MPRTAPPSSSRACSRSTPAESFDDPRRRPAGRRPPAGRRRPGARADLPADLRRLRRGNGRPRRLLRRVLVRAQAHRGAVLRPPRHPLRRRSRHRSPAVAEGHRATAGLRASEGRGPLRRRRPPPRSPSEIRGSARSRQADGAHDGGRGPRSHRRIRLHRAGAAAPLAAMAASLQSGRVARPAHRRGGTRFPPGSPRPSSGNPHAGRSEPSRAGGEPRGRFSCPRAPETADRRSPYPARRRRDHDGCHRQRRSAGAAAGRGGVGELADFRPGERAVG